MKAENSKIQPREVLITNPSKPWSPCNGFKVEFIGIAKNKDFTFPVVYHRLIISHEVKYRVWLIPGDERYLTLDPSEFSERYEIIKEFAPDGSKPDEKHCPDCGQPL